MSSGLRSANASRDFYGELAINNFSVPLLPFCTGITNPLEYGSRIGKVKIIG